MRYAYLLTLLAASLALAQSTQPATAPSTQPAKVDRTTPVGLCMTFDRTIADLGVEKGMTFYHCTTPMQKRYARSELERYVAINTLVRIVADKYGVDAGREVRQLCGDSDDYSNATVNEDGDAAAIQSGEGQPFPLIRIDGQWYMSLPDLFDMTDLQDLMARRLAYELLADRLNGVIDDVNAGKLKSKDEIIQHIASGEQ